MRMTNERLAVIIDKCFAGRQELYSMALDLQDARKRIEELEACVNADGDCISALRCENEQLTGVKVSIAGERDYLHNHMVYLAKASAEQREHFLSWWLKREKETGGGQG